LGVCLNPLHPRLLHQVPEHNACSISLWQGVTFYAFLYCAFTSSFCNRKLMENKTKEHPRLLRANTLIEGSDIDSIAINASFRAIDVVEYISVEEVLVLDQGWANIFYGGPY